MEAEEQLIWMTHNRKEAQKDCGTDGRAKNYI